MFVHRAGAGEQLLEVRRADRELDREPDCGPERIPAADPVPDLEAGVGTDAEGIHGRGIRRYRREVLRHGGLAELGADPGAGAARIGDRLLRREGLGADDEQRARGIQLDGEVRKLRAVHVGDEMATDIAGVKRPQCCDRHGRTEVAAADADIDDIGEALARSIPCACRHGHRRRRPRIARAPRAPLHAAPSTAPTAESRRGTQQSVERRALLGVVDRLALEHRVDARHEPGAPGPFERGRSGRFHRCAGG